MTKNFPIEVGHKLDEIAELIKAYCCHLFSRLPLQYFNYGRFYLSGESLVLSTNAKLVKHQIINNYPFAIIPECPDISEKASFFNILTINNCRHPLFIDEQTLFGHAETLDYFCCHASYYEMYCFAAQKNCQNATSMFLNNTEYIKLFCTQFSIDLPSLTKLITLNTTSHFLSKIQVNDIEQNTKKFLRQYNNPQSNKKALTSMNYRSLELLAPKRFYLDADNMQRYLTKTQFDIIKATLHGATAKEIGKNLQCSPRTVERHLENIRLKLDCSSRKMLFNTIIHSDLFYLIYSDEAK